MVDRVSSMAHRFRTWTVSASAALLLAAALPAGAAYGAPDGVCRTWTDRAACRWAAGLLERMTLEEKVGQLFVTYAYGETADTTNAADVAANRSAYGVDN